MYILKTFFRIFHVSLNIKNKVPRTNLKDGVSVKELITFFLARNLKENLRQVPILNHVNNFMLYTDTTCIHTFLHT